MTKDKKEEEAKTEEQPCECKKFDHAEAAKQMFHAFTSRETQKHFIRAGVEFALAIENIMRSVPVPDNVQKAKDASSDYVGFVIKEAFCAHNPYCDHREEGGVKKVELD